MPAWPTCHPRLAAVLVGLGLVTASVPAVAGPTLRDHAAHALRGPVGWAAWCEREPARCARATPVTITVDAATEQTLQQVFAAVRDRVRPQLEAPGSDVWRIIDGHGHGDCEDFALTWREALVAAGLPRGALDIAVARTERGEVHAVLAIHTDRGTLIFDNRHDRPRPWASLPYGWLALEPVATGPASWLALQDHHLIGAQPPLTAEGAGR